MESALNFRGNDPGAVKYGNFINYYEFHPPEHRMTCLPRNAWSSQDENLICMDIGCNAGDLTQALYEFFSQSFALSQSKISEMDCFILAVDLDPVLVERAQETNKFFPFVKYECLDFMSDRKDYVIASFLQCHKRTKFDIVFCFSLTMWIHLNHGDEGLKNFLSDACKWTDKIVIEAQPWKCYRSAVKRLTRAGDFFPMYSSLKIQDTVENHIDMILRNECKFIKIYESSASNWDRKVVVYQKSK